MPSIKPLFPIKPFFTPLRSLIARFLRPERPDDAQVFQAFLAATSEPGLFPEYRSLVRVQQPTGTASTATTTTTKTTTASLSSSPSRLSSPSSSDGVRKLRIAIGVPDAFHYGNLLHSTERSTRWRSSLRKYCCLRTGVRWWYMPSDKLVLVEGTVTTVNNNNHGGKRSKSLNGVARNMNRAALVLQDWLAFETQRQALDVPDHRDRKPGTMTAAL